VSVLERRRSEDAEDFVPEDIPEFTAEELEESEEEREEREEERTEREEERTENPKRR